MQDLSLHLDEIHTKLVDIMQDRLQLAVRQPGCRLLLTQHSDAGCNEPYESHPRPAAACGQPAGGGSGGAMVGDAVRGLVKSLGTLRAVLSPILQQEEVAYIFGRVASLYRCGCMH
ncbi:hypothetical protein FOA52_006413 [Chlamydomonas sp. UWO 241]|nr:hypothetical protein FOA52_006413 [Chlamydomonas sp. UWO 241]